MGRQAWFVVDGRRQSYKQIITTQASKCSGSVEGQSWVHGEGHFEPGLKEKQDSPCRGRTGGMFAGGRGDRRKAYV